MKIGKISALTWVRVSTTTFSPSFSSFGEMATGRSCHRSVGPHVDYVTRADRGLPVGSGDDQPAAGVHPGRPARSAPRRRAARPGRRGPRSRTPRRTTSAGAPSRVLAAGLPGVVRLPQRAEHGHQQRGPVGLGARLDRQRGRRSAPGARRRSGSTLSPTPTTAAGPSGVSIRSTRMPATLRSPISTSLGHFTPASYPSARAAPCSTA